MKEILDVKLWMHLLEIEITSRCNLNCLHCYNRNEPTMDMDYNSIIELVEFANINHIKKLILTGGEACLHEEFGKILSYLNENRKRLSNIEKIVLQTNGLIDKYLNIYDFSCFDLVHLSFDIDNNNVRETTENSTINLSKKLTKKGISSYLFSTVHRNNFEHIEEMIKVANYNDIPIVFNLCMNNGRNASVLLTKQEKIEVYKKLLEYEEKGNIRPLKNPYLNSLKNMCTDTYEGVKGGCTAGIASCSVLPNGDVIPCPFLRLKVGNIHEKKLEDIWLNSEELAVLRNRKKYEKCGECKHLSYCGGCRKSALTSSNKLNGYDNACLI